MAKKIPSKVKTNVPETVQAQQAEELAQAEAIAAEKANAKLEALSVPEMEDEEMSEDEAPEAMERRYSGQQKIDSDLYKLEVAVMKKNSALRKTDKPVWVHHEHTHVFRTYDSSGKKQTQSSPVGGHYHEVEVIQNPKGGVPSIKIGPPVKRVQSKVDGEFIIQTVAIPGDTHTHRVGYLRSDKITIRKLNPEAMETVRVVESMTNPRLPQGAVENS